MLSSDDKLLRELSRRN